jgi:hypothetical protein
MRTFFIKRIPIPLGDCRDLSPCLAAFCYAGSLRCKVAAGNLFLTKVLAAVKPLFKHGGVKDVVVGANLAAFAC